MITIDVLIPSRARPHLLERSVLSLRQTAGGPADLIIHVEADSDDPETIAAAQRLGTDCRATFPPRPGYAGLHVYYQQMAARSHGDWLLVWNDDAQMLTPGWDGILAALPPPVLVADVQTPHSPLCCFPAVRQQAVQALGRFCTDNPHVDTFWQDVGRATGTIVQVDIRASLESPVNPGNTHGFYEAAHQDELRSCAETIRRYVNGLGQGH